MAVVTKKEAMLRQIHGAIEHLLNGQLECAITLAGAAEGLCEDKNSEALFEKLKSKRPEEFSSDKECSDWMNVTIHWLKHLTPQIGDELDIREMDSVIVVLRAVTKFQWKYRQTTAKIESYLKWSHDRGYPGRLPH